MVENKERRWSSNRDYGSTSISRIEADRVQQEEEGTARFRTIDEFLNDAYKFGASQSYFCLRCVAIRYYFIILSLCVANSSFSTTILLVSYLLADDAFDDAMFREKKSQGGGPLASAVFAGMLLGGIFSGTICDRVGRKPTLLVALAVGTVANFLTAVSPDVVSLSLARFVAGIANGAMEPPLFTLVTELSPPRWRGLLVTTVASFWMIGNIYVAVVGLIIFQHLQWSWRVYVAACVFPSLLGFIMVALCTFESPRFLATVRGHYAEATRISNEIGDAMGYSEQMRSAIRNKFGHDRRALSEAEVLHYYPRKESQGEDTTASETLQAALKNLSMLYRDGIGSGTTLPLQVVWFSLCYGSYCIVVWINVIFVMVNLDDVYFNALLFALTNFPGNIISFITIDCAGRIPTLVWCLILSALSLMVFAWYAYQSSLGNASAAAGVVASACAFQALETSAWNSLDVMTGEVFPTRIRSTGVGMCTATGRAGALVAQFASGALIDRPVILLLAAGAAFAVGAVTPCALKEGEMLRLPLDDGISDGDRENESGEGQL